MPGLKGGFVLALAAVCTAAMGIGAQAQDAPKGDPANGKRVYLAENCFTCHGRVGQGGAYNGELSPNFGDGRDQAAAI